MREGDQIISNECKQPKIMWPRRDFIWLCTVFVIILIANVSLVLGGSIRAFENLSFAATTVSVVLAVIAIVITLVDVAGQKHNVMQLQETSEELRDSLEEISNLVRGTSNNLESLKEVTEEYKLRFKKMLNGVKQSLLN